MKSYSEITYKYLKQQKKRTILTLIGITLSIALITAIFTMLISVREESLNRVRKDAGDYHVIFNNVPSDKLNYIKNNVQVDKIGLAQKPYCSLINGTKDSDTGRNKYAYVKSYDKDTFNIFNIKVDEGKAPEKEGEIAVELVLFEYLKEKPKIGDKIKFPIGYRENKATGKILKDNEGSKEEVYKKTGEKEYTITGTFKGNSFSQHPRAYSFLDNSKYGNKVEKLNVFIKVKKPSEVYKFAKDTSATLKLDESNIEYNEELLRYYGKSMNPNINKTLVGMVIFIISIIIIATIAVIYNSFNISVMERISAFGILRCVGASPKQIKHIVIKEAIVLSLISIPLGLLLGVASMKIVIYIIGLISVEFISGMRVVVSPVVLILSSVLGICTVYISALGPSKLASKVSPLEAVRHMGNNKKESLRKVKSSRITKTLFKVQGDLAYKNLRRNKKRFRITIFSMIISIVLFIVFNTMVNYSFKMGVANRNDKSQKDFVIYNTIHTVENSNLEKAYERIKDNNGIGKLYKEMAKDLFVDVGSERLTKEYKKYYFKDDQGNEKSKTDFPILSNSHLVSYGDDNLEELRTLLKAGKIDKKVLNTENGVLLINKNMFDEYSKGGNKKIKLDATNYKVGEYINFYVNEKDFKEKKNMKKVKILGILEEGILSTTYSQFGINMITTEETFKKLTGKNNMSNLCISAKDEKCKADIASELKKINKQYPYLDIYDSSERSKNARKGNIVMSIFLYGFVSVISIISILNIINTISTNLLLRKKELSMLMAVGMDRSQVNKMVYLESILYGVISSIYGGVIGTALVYVLFKIVIGIVEFSWNIPWGSIGIAASCSILIAVISAYIPLKKINKGNIIENIRMEE